MGAGRRHRHRVPQMRAPTCVLLPDADTLRRRAHDRLLSVPEVRPSLEGALTLRLLAAMLVLCTVTPTSTRAEEADRVPPFEIVVFTCIWKRPPVTAFVLAHYQRLHADLAPQNIALSRFVVGSEGNQSRSLATEYGASYFEAPNEPLGAKHNLGLLAVPVAFPSASAVVIIGSDDILNAQYFSILREKMTQRDAPVHVLGLRDLYFYDLASDKLAYTKGYRNSETQLAATIGLGRAFSRPTLDILGWQMWDAERNRGLDQSAVRNLLTRVPGLELVTYACSGRDAGIMAVDVKSSGLEKGGGTNIWAFETIMAATKPGGKLYDFELTNSSKHEMGKAFGDHFWVLTEKLRQEML